MSPSAVSSKWVREEVEQALIERQERGLKILAVILHPCEIPDQIRGITALRAYEGYVVTYLSIMNIDDFIFS
jgi:hypothetical protein